MRIRIVAIGLLIAFLAFAGALISVPLLIGDPLPVVRPDARISHPIDTEAGHTDARLRVNAAGEFVLLFALPPATREPPRVIFTMPDHDMAIVEPEIRVIGDGRYRATGRLAMPGHWRLRIERAAQAHEMGFVLAEF